MLELDWLALGVAVKYQLPLDNSPQSTLMWKRHQAFSTHRRTLMSERLIKTPIRYYFDNIMERVKRREYVLDIYVWINVLYMLTCYRYVIRNERCLRQKIGVTNLCYPRLWWLMYNASIHNGCSRKG